MIWTPQLWKPERAGVHNRRLAAVAARAELDRSRQALRRRRRERGGFIFTPGTGCDGAGCHCASAGVECACCTSDLGPAFWEVDLGVVGTGGPLNPSLEFWRDTLFVVEHYSGCIWLYEVTETTTPTNDYVYVGLACADPVTVVELNVGVVSIIGALPGNPISYIYTARWRKTLSTSGPADCMSLSNESIPLSASGSGYGIQWSTATCNITSGS